MQRGQLIVLAVFASSCSSTAANSPKVTVAASVTVAATVASSSPTATALSGAGVAIINGSIPGTSGAVLTLSQVQVGVEPAEPHSSDLPGR